MPRRGHRMIATRRLIKPLPSRGAQSDSLVAVNKTSARRGYRPTNSPSEIVAVNKTTARRGHRMAATRRLIKPPPVEVTVPRIHPPKSWRLIKPLPVGGHRVIEAASFIYHPQTPVRSIKMRRMAENVTTTQKSETFFIGLSFIARISKKKAIRNIHSESPVLG